VPLAGVNATAAAELRAGEARALLCSPVRRSGLWPMRTTSIRLSTPLLQLAAAGAAPLAARCAISRERMARAPRSICRWAAASAHHTHYDSAALTLQLLALCASLWPPGKPQLSKSWRAVFNTFRKLAAEGLVKVTCPAGCGHWQHCDRDGVRVCTPGRACASRPCA